MKLERKSFLQETVHKRSVDFFEYQGHDFWFVQMHFPVLWAPQHELHYINEKADISAAVSNPGNTKTALKGRGHKFHFRGELSFCGRKIKKIKLCRNCLFFFFFLSIKRKNPHKNNTMTAIKYLPQMLWYAFHWSINELSCQTRLQIYLLCITGKKQCMKPKLQSHTNPSIWQRSQNQIKGFAKSVKLRGKKENSKPLWPAFRSNTDRRTADGHKTPICEREKQKLQMLPLKAHLYF